MIILQESMDKEKKEKLKDKLKAAAVGVGATTAARKLIDMHLYKTLAKNNAIINDKINSGNVKAAFDIVHANERSVDNHERAKKAALVSGAAAAYGAYKYLQNKKKKKNIIKRVLHV